MLICKIISYIGVFISLLVVSPTLTATELDSDRSEAVSILKLIVDPGAFEDRNIIVTGYFDFGVHPTLYLNHLAAEAGDFNTGIKVRDDTEHGDIVESCSGKYVTVWGRLVSSVWNFEVTDVRKIVDTKSGKICWTSKND